jgi:hypothetical protein
MKKSLSISILLFAILTIVNAQSDYAGDITIGYDSITLARTYKIDTVSLRVLCESPSRPKCLYCNPGIEFRSIKQERTLEWRTWDSNTTQYAVYKPKSDWVTTECRWLEDINGCYQLVPLED